MEYKIEATKLSDDYYSLKANNGDMGRLVKSKANDTWVGTIVRDTKDGTVIWNGMGSTVELVLQDLRGNVRDTGPISLNED